MLVDFWAPDALDIRTRTGRHPRGKSHARRSRAVRFHSSRRSSTSTDICHPSTERPWQKRSRWPTRRSKRGSRTDAPNGGKNRSFVDYSITHRHIMLWHRGRSYIQSVDYIWEAFKFYRGRTNIFLWIILRIKKHTILLFRMVKSFLQQKSKFYNFQSLGFSTF